jgi:hypothetical protein
MSGVIIKKTEYKGWKNCIEMSNSVVTLVITTDVGPRIISFGFLGKRNIFLENEKELGTIGGDVFKFYGGHRLWHSPQEGARPSECANDPVEYEIKGNTVLLKQKTEPIARIQKMIEVTLAGEGTEVTVKHRLVNRHVWPVKTSAWGLTMCAPGGVEIIPWVVKKTPDYYPNAALVYWPWTKPNDPRMSFYEKYILLRQDSNNSTWFKLGMLNDEGWAAYINQSFMFVKTFDCIDGAEYPDFISSYETFTDNIFLEMETLSPLALLGTNEAVESVEKWYLFDHVLDPKNEADIDKDILPLIRKCKN